MKMSRLNLLTAILALCASALWFAAGQLVTGLVWLAASLVWSALALAQVRSSDTASHATDRLFRRLSRLLIWS